MLSSIYNAFFGESNEKSTTKSKDEESNDLIEAYILYKTLGEKRYTINTDVSHHICLLKSRDQKFYYTDLNPNEGNSCGALSKMAPIALRFGEEYEFYPTRKASSFPGKLSIFNESSLKIWYKPLGKIHVKFNAMKQFVETHRFHGTIFRLVSVGNKSNNCQDYVRSCIEFLQPENSVTKIYNGTTFTSSDYIYGAFDPSEIRLNPSKFEEYGDGYLRDTFSLADASMLYVGDRSKLSFFRQLTPSLSFGLS